MQNNARLLTVEWKNNKFIMIEQTKLPNKINYLFNNIQKNKQPMNSVFEVKNTLKYSLHS